MQFPNKLLFFVNLLVFMVKGQYTQLQFRAGSDKIENADLSHSCTIHVNTFIQSASMEFNTWAKVVQKCALCDAIVLFCGNILSWVGNPFAVDDNTFISFHVQWNHYRAPLVSCWVSGTRAPGSGSFGPSWLWAKSRALSLQKAQRSMKSFQEQAVVFKLFHKLLLQSDFNLKSSIEY